MPFTAPEKSKLEIAVPLFRGAILPFLDFRDNFNKTAQAIETLIRKAVLEKDPLAENGLMDKAYHTFYEEFNSRTNERFKAEVSEHWKAAFKREFGGYPSNLDSYMPLIRMMTFDCIMRQVLNPIDDQSKLFSDEERRTIANSNKFLEIIKTFKSKLSQVYIPDPARIISTNDSPSVEESSATTPLDPAIASRINSRNPDYCRLVAIAIAAGMVGGAVVLIAAMAKYLESPPSVELDVWNLSAEQLFGTAGLPPEFLNYTQITESLICCIDAFQQPWNNIYIYSIVDDSFSIVRQATMHYPLQVMYSGSDTSFFNTTEYISPNTLPYGPLYAMYGSMICGLFGNNPVFRLTQNQQNTENMIDHSLLLALGCVIAIIILSLVSHAIFGAIFGKKPINETVTEADIFEFIETANVCMNAESMATGEVVIPPAQDLTTSSTANTNMSIRMVLPANLPFTITPQLTPQIMQLRSIFLSSASRNVISFLTRRYPIYNFSNGQGDIPLQDISPRRIEEGRPATEMDKRDTAVEAPAPAAAEPQASATPHPGS